MGKLSLILSCVDDLECVENDTVKSISSIVDNNSEGEGFWQKLGNFVIATIAAIVIGTVVAIVIVLVASTSVGILIGSGVFLLGIAFYNVITSNLGHGLRYNEEAVIYRYDSDNNNKFVENIAKNLIGKDENVLSTVDLKKYEEDLEKYKKIAQELLDLYNYLHINEGLSGSELDRVFWGIISEQRYSGLDWHSVKGNYGETLDSFKNSGKFQNLFNYILDDENSDHIDLAHMGANLSTDGQWNNIFLHDFMVGMSGVDGDMASEYYEFPVGPDKNGDKNLDNDSGNYNQMDKITDEIALNLMNNKVDDSTAVSFINTISSSTGYDYEHIGNSLELSESHKKFWESVTGNSVSIVGE